MLRQLPHLRRGGRGVDAVDVGGGGGGVLELQLLLGHAGHGRRLGRGQEHRRGAARARGSCTQGRSGFVLELETDRSRKRPQQ